MKNVKYKILVLSDLRKSSENILKNTAALARTIGGEIRLLHIKRPLSVVKHENQLSAVRSINDSYTATKKQIQGLVQPISEAYGVKIEADFTVGNVKEGLKKHIDAFRPDIVVMGQRKSTPINPLGDRIAKYIMSTFEGVVMIASHHHTLETDHNLSLGMFNGTKESLNADLLKELVARSTQPITSFKIAQRRKTLVQQEVASDKNIVEYTFEQQDNVIDNMSRYLSKIGVDVLFVDTEDAAQTNINVKDVIGKFNVPLLLAGASKSNYRNTLN
ncbi:MAG: universal stress protein [Allomuricauda sp.]